MIVTLVALVGGVSGAIGAAAFHWNVIQLTDAEMETTISASIPSGFVVDWGPGVSGKWGLELDRGRARMGLSSDDRVSIETVAADLQGNGWTTQVNENTGPIHSMTAFKDHLWLGATVWYNRASITAPVDEDEHGTLVELALERRSQTPSLGATTALGMTLAIAASVALTLRLTRRRT